VTQRHLRLGLFVVALTGCQSEPELEPAAQVSEQGGIINLLTLERMEGGGTLALQHGVFRRKGRCLVIDVDGVSATPVFAVDSGIAVGANGIRITGLDFNFGETVALPGLGPSYTGDSVAECPVIRRLVRAVETARPAH